MPYENRDNSGIMFTNRDKVEGDKKPDRRGDAKIDGVDYEIGGWIRRDKNGKPFLSLSFQKKDAWKKDKPQAPQQQSFADELDDEIPY